MTDLIERKLHRLAGKLSGGLSRPGQQPYAAATAIWAKPVGRMPRVVAHCRTPEDVRAAIQTARDCELPLSVRSGGHDWAGRALCEGLVLDISGMNGVTVDSAERTAQIAGGARASDVLTITDPLGLAAVTGSCSPVGMAGLTLGGGYGPLIGRFGLALDNLMAVEIVLADGRIVTAEHGRDEDLFWALRGGGGNFGIVTSFRYRLRPVGPTVIGGAVLYAYKDAMKVLRHFREFAPSVPDPLTVFACLIYEAGQPVVAIAACHAMPHEAGDAATAPLRSWGAVVADQLRSMSYVELQSLFDAARPAGRRCAMRSNFMAGLPDAAIEILVEQFAATPSTLSAVIVEHCHGAITRVPADATAFGLRGNPYHLEILGFWDSPDEDEADQDWVEGFFAAMQPFNAGEVYVNSLDQGEGHRVREAYGVNYDRLVALKAKFDPTNFFRCNQNIPPR